MSPKKHGGTAFGESREGDPPSVPGTGVPGLVGLGESPYFFFRMGIPVLVVSWTT
jgi:hypothetical protein